MSEYSATSWDKCTIRSCLHAEFSGAWGTKPGYSGPNAYVLRSTNIDDDGHIDFSRAAGRLVSDAELATRRLQSGDVLLETSGGGPGKPVGRVAHFTKSDKAPYIASNFFRTLRPDHSRIDSRFLAWQLLMLHRQPSIWNFQQQTTGIINLKVRDYLAHQIFLPEMSEQLAIVAALNAADSIIARTEAVIAKLKQIRTGLLHDLLTRGLDENGELREPAVHPERFQDSPLGRIPACWDITSVEQAGEVRLGRQRSPAHETGEHIRPYLRVANVFDCFIDYSDVLSMNFNPYEQETYRLCAGDILLNEGQSLELVGRSAIYQGRPNAYCFQNTLVRFRCNDTTIPEYCQAVFKYWLDTGAFTRIAKQTTSVAHLGADRFAKMLFPRPTLFEQRLIADRLAEIAAMQESESAELRKLCDIKVGLMSDLLTGRVRVPADLELN